MAAAAHSAEAGTKLCSAQVAKPWLGSAPQAGNLGTAMLRGQENPFAKYSHLKALADRRGVDLGHALGASKKATDHVYETLRIDDRQSFMQTGTQGRQKGTQPIFVAGLDYKSFISAALEEAQYTMQVEPSKDPGTDMRTLVEGRVAWVPKMEDYFMGEDSIEADNAFPTYLPIPSRQPPAAKARFSVAPARPSDAKSSQADHPRRISPQQSQRHSSCKSAKQSTRAARTLHSGSSAAIVAKLNRHALATGPMTGIVSTEPSSSRVHAEGKDCSVPWQNEQLLAQRALRKDDIHSRITSFDEKIRARKAGGGGEKACAKSSSPPQHDVDWHRRPTTVATMDTASGVAGASNEMPPRKDSVAGTKVHDSLPTDSDLDAMEPMVALMNLHDVEQQLLRELCAPVQSVRDRVRLGSKGKRSKRIVWFKGGSNGCAPLQDAETKAARGQLLEALDAIIPKRNTVVRRLMHGMDGMSKTINKELTQLMLRKRVVDKQDAMARQAIRRAERADALTGSGYITIRFKDEFGNRPFTAL